MPRPPARPSRRPRKTVYAGTGAYRKSTVPRNVVRGRGFYKGFGTDAGHWLGGLAGTAGQAMGVPGASAALGSKVGSWIGGKAANATGWGAYKVAHNAILTPDIPTVRNARSMEGAVIVRHKEYICDIKATGAVTSGSTAFHVEGTYSLNPGIATGFPWLSGVAAQFQEYKLNGVIFEYKPTSGSAISGTNAALGEVMLATQYNVLNAAFTSKQQMMNEEFSVSTVPCNAVLHPIECAQGQTPVDKLYIRTTTAPSGSDLRLYDLGTVTVATQGQQATGITLGELYVTYEVLLFKPSLSAS